jgi:transmembrane sensor
LPNGPARPKAATAPADDELRFFDWLDQSETHRDAYRLVERALRIAGTIPQARNAAAAGSRGERESRRPGWRRHLARASLLLAFTLG